MKSYTVKSYKEANEVLGNRDEKKVNHNTYLVRRADGSISLRLYETNIVTYYETGEVALYAGGFRTVTTKERMKEYSPLMVYSTNHAWFVRSNNKSEPFRDGISTKEFE